MDTFTRITVLLAAACLTAFWIRMVRFEARAGRRMRELNRELDELRGKFGRLDASKSYLITITSHQLRAPLALMREYVALFLDGSLGPATALARQSMQKVLASADQLLNVVGHLFELSRIEHGQLEETRDEVMLGTLVSQVLQDHAPRAKAKGLHMHFENHTNGQDAVSADSRRLGETIRHFIDNAVRYTSAGRVHIAVTAEKEGIRPWVKVSVLDTGIGIQPADISRLFMKFSRTDEARRIRPDGLGLGLYFAKCVIEGHGGQVGASSPGLGRGSTFWFKIPGSA